MLVPASFSVCTGATIMGGEIYPISRTGVLRAMVICLACRTLLPSSAPPCGTPARCCKEVDVFSLRDVPPVRTIRSVICRQTFVTCSSIPRNSLCHTFGAYNGKLAPLREHFHSCASLVPRSVASPPHHNHISVHFATAADFVTFFITAPRHSFIQVQ